MKNQTTTKQATTINNAFDLLFSLIQVLYDPSLSKCLVSRHMLNSFTDHQNWHDILPIIIIMISMNISIHFFSVQCDLERSLLHKLAPERQDAGIVYCVC